MDKETHQKYLYLSKNPHIYQKLLTINNLQKRKDYINNNYYQIAKTNFLTKKGTFDYSYIYKIHEYRIKLAFNWFNMTSHIIIDKTIKASDHISQQKKIMEFNDVSYLQFNEAFIKTHILAKLNAYNELDALAKILATKKYIKKQYQKLLIHIHQLQLNPVSRLPKELYTNITHFLF